MTEVAVNAHVSTRNKATGRPEQPCLVSLITSREQFGELVLTDLDPSECLRHLNALVSKHPWDLEAVRPVFDPDLSRYKFVDAHDAAADLDSRPVLCRPSPDRVRAPCSSALRGDGPEVLGDPGIPRRRCRRRRGERGPDHGRRLRHPGQALPERRLDRGGPRARRRHGPDEGEPRGPGHDLLVREAVPRVRCRARPHPADRGQPPRAPCCRSISTSTSSSANSKAHRDACDQLGGSDSGAKGRTTTRTTSLADAAAWRRSSPGGLLTRVPGFTKLLRLTADSECNRCEFVPA